MTSAPLSCRTCDKVATDEEHAWVAKWVDERVVAFQQSGGTGRGRAARDQNPSGYHSFVGTMRKSFAPNSKTPLWCFNSKPLRPSAA